MAAGQFQHIYVSAHGTYDDAPWQDETAQIGFRVAVVPITEEPSPGHPFTHPTDHGDITLDIGTTVGASGVLTHGWTARLGPSGSTHNVTAAIQLDIAEDVVTFLSSIKTYQSNGFRWRYIKIAPQDSLGHYGEAAASVYDLSTPIAGVGTGDMMPPECAVAMSLRAPISGRRGRGRMYLPAVVETALAPNGTIGGSALTNLGTALATLIADVDDAPGLDVYTPVVCVTSSGQPGAVRPSEVRVGSLWDVQRRRQAQAAETYISQAL